MSEIEEKDVFLTLDRVLPVREMIAQVREKGDSALYALTERFDGARLETLAVAEQEIDDAMRAVEPEFLEILREAAGNIRRYHEKQKRESFVMTEREGVVLGQKNSAP